MLSRSAATNRSRMSRPPAPDHDVLTNLLVQHIGHRVGVADDRDRTIRLRAGQQQPRIGAFVIGGGASEPETQSGPWPGTHPSARESCGFFGSYRFRQLASSPGSSRNGSKTIAGVEVEEVHRRPARCGCSRRRRSAAAFRRRRAYPPTPECAPVSSTPSPRRKASTEIRMNVADAITAIDNTLRPGTIARVAEAETRHRLPAMPVERARAVPPERQREQAQRRHEQRASPHRRTRPRGQSTQRRRRRAEHTPIAANATVAIRVP